MHVVLLPLGAEWYAVPVESVREVVSAPSVAPLATAPPVVLGLFNLRGQIVPLFDTAVLLGVGTMGTTGSTEFAAVMQTPDGSAGLATTALPQRAVLDAAIGLSELPGTTGTYQVDGRVVVLLDPTVLLTAERLAGRDRDPATSGGWG
jgi:chemotaxis signal transduction protein